MNTLEEVQKHIDQLLVAKEILEMEIEMLYKIRKEVVKNV